MQPLSQRMVDNTPSRWHLSANVCAQKMHLRQTEIGVSRPRRHSNAQRSEARTCPRRVGGTSPSVQEGPASFFQSLRLAMGIRSRLYRKGSQRQGCESKLNRKLSTQSSFCSDDHSFESTGVNVRSSPTKSE
jgi:hypothetical protein